MSTEAASGEIDSSALTTTDPPVEAVVEDVAALDGTATETVTDPPADDGKPKKPGMLEELIEHRTIRRRLEGEREQLAPVLSRLTPELEQAILDGRIVVKPKATTDEGRQEQLIATAKRLRLHKADGTPDLEAAAAVDSYVREVSGAAVSAAVGPMQHETQLQKARANIDIAVAHATANGHDAEMVRRHYENALRAPNGAALVADPGVAEELWYGAIGRAASIGKVAKKEPPASDGAPTVIPSEGTGRRGPASGIQLSPKLAAIYKDNGMDPAKTSAQPIVRNARGGIDME